MRASALMIKENKMEAMLAEKHGIKKLLGADVNGGVTSGYIEMKHSHRVGIIVDAPAAAEQLDLSFVQAQDSSGTGAKALSVETKYFVKVGADLKFTKKDIVGSQIQDADFNGAAGLLVVDILAEDLDVNNGFGHVAVSLTGGVARVVDVKAVAHEMKKGAAYLEEL